MGSLARLGVFPRDHSHDLRVFVRSQSLRCAPLNTRRYDYVSNEKLTDHLVGLVVTTRKWSICDAKKDVGIKNVGKKGILDAVKTASGEASGKSVFQTHQTGVGHAASGKDQINFKKHIILYAMHKLKPREEEIVETEREKERRRSLKPRGEKRGDQIVSVAAICHFRKKERKRSSKLRGDRTIPSPFCRRSVAVCHFSMSSLREKENQSIVWSYFGKHTFKLGRSCRRPPRMRIIKCWNSNPNLPHRVVSHSLRMRYAIGCWVDDLATQKALSSGSVERTHQSRDPEGCTYQSSDPEECTYQSSDPEGCTYQSSDPEGCTYQSSDPEGCTYQSSDPKGCTYQSSDPKGCTYQSSDPEGYTYPFNRGSDLKRVSSRLESGQLETGATTSDGLRRSTTGTLRGLEESGEHGGTKDARQRPGA
ncbi:NBS-LRR type resistance protein [Cucumis melo var. makuwa]|uniref:NBS-LRR type resistance protein n=1 Tax=Cucumis melo var. makuwa TaxID=1194695 RepID=A0A5A7TTZ4_CUCMM|nr:NBS-LRR type resistance protein [Cucumis melo var. makuwa]